VVVETESVLCGFVSWSFVLLVTLVGVVVRVGVGSGVGVLLWC
jgi:hypothetical protein